MSHFHGLDIDGWRGIRLSILDLDAGIKIHLVASRLSGVESDLTCFLDTSHLSLTVITDS